MEAIRRGAYQLWRVLIALFALASLTQFFLAGAGVFGATDNLDPHSTLGHLMLIPGSVVLLIVGLIYWRERWVWLGSLALGLILFLQAILGGVEEPWVNAFHPVNALVVLGLSFGLTRRAWGWGVRPMGARAEPAGTTRDVV